MKRADTCAAQIEQSRGAWKATQKFWLSSYCMSQLGWEEKWDADKLLRECPDEVDDLFVGDGWVWKAVDGGAGTWDGVKVPDCIVPATASEMSAGEELK